MWQWLVNPKTIARKLFIFFIMTALVPLVLVAFLTIMGGQQKLMDAQLERIQAVTQHKITQIETYAANMKSNLAVLTTVPTIVHACECLTAPASERVPESDTVQQERRALQSFLATYQGIKHFYDFYVISPSGDIVFSFLSENGADANILSGTYPYSALTEAFRASRQSSKPEISSVKYYHPSKKYALFVTAPIMQKKTLMGMLAFQVDQQAFEELAADYSGLGYTGETVLGAVVGDSVIFVAPTRHDPHAAFRHGVDLASGGFLPIAEAAQGKRGSGRAFDYRNKKVMAVWHPIRSFRWGIVVKIDEEEALAPLAAFGALVLGISCVAVLMALVCALIVARAILKPIRALQQGTVRIGTGDLNCTVGTNARDEIGELSRAFDAMTENLKHTTTSISLLNQEIHQRQEAEQALQKAMEAKSAFTSMVSHELRTPLGPIREGASIILDGLTGPITAEQKDLLETVTRNADRLGRLINNVLDFQKLEAGMMPFHMHEHSLVDIIADVYKTMAIVTQEKKISFTVTCAPDMPPVRCDKDKIIQVLINLINNAVKFTVEGGITVTATRETNSVHVIVADTGPGIKAEDLPRLFHSFQQLDKKPNQKNEGTGLGLAISKEIILGHRGKIWAESEVGRGTSFHFVLPLEERRNSA